MSEVLNEIAAALKAGKEPKATTTRDFLGWFGAQRRGYNIVAYIHSELDKAGLYTVPDFVSAWIDGPISFRLKAGQPEISGESLAGPAGPEPVPEPIINWVSRDPTYRISKLAAANGGVTSVNPDAELSEAVTLMMSRDYSQLPVMSGERSVRGVISWLSIGSKLALGRNSHIVRELMNDAKEVRSESSIFDAIPLIVQHGYVLVRDDTQVVTGIVT